MTIHKGLLKLVAILFIQSGLFAQVAPDLLLPEDGSENIQWEAVQFNWTMVDTEVVYQVEISNNGAFNSSLYNELIEDNFTEVNDLFSNWQFSWRVRAGYESDTADYRFTDWSDVSTFKTVYVAPENIAPFDSSIGEDYSLVQLEWQLDLHPLIDSDSSFFILQVSTDNSFSNIIFEELEISSISTVVTDLEADTRYFWRVKYKNPHGESEWSEPTSFVTSSPHPEKVTLLLPENGTTNINPENITFSWQDVENATGYTFELAEDSSFLKILESSPLISTEYTTSVLLFDSRIYWRVLASNDAGDGDWSDVWSFETSITAPQTPPALLSPVDSTSGYSAGNLEFEWRGVHGADNYEIEISENIGFTVLLTSEITFDTLVTLNLELMNDQYYFWRVKAENDSGSGPWSEVRSFYTGEITGIEDFAYLSESFDLKQNYPNPFNPTTTISYQLANRSPVKLKIFNLLGQHIATLVDDEQAPGFYKVTWDGSNVYGQQTASGVYIYRLEAFSSDGYKIIKSNKMIKLM